MASYQNIDDDTVQRAQEQTFPTPTKLLDKQTSSSLHNETLSKLLVSASVGLQKCTLGIIIAVLFRFVYCLVVIVCN
jgi:hypothetical protein